MVASAPCFRIKEAIFTVYVLLWVLSHLLIYASKLAGAPPFNSTSAVLFTELVKLLLALGLYIRFDGNAKQLTRTIAATTPLLLKYSVPALLYAVYNNLVYVNLASFDPGTYNVLMQLRIIMTGVIYQQAFSKRLNRNQWMAIVLIAIGCMAKESSKLTSTEGIQQNRHAWLLLLIQMLSSVCAGVYNEVLLKGEDSSPTADSGILVTTNLQNAYMYLMSVFWNLLVLTYQGRLGEAVSHENLIVLCSPIVLSIIAIMSTVGLVTGFFLKHLDSVLKAVASALEVILTMLASNFFFGIPLDAQGLVATCLVGGGVALYARPVSLAQPAYERVPARDVQYDDEEDGGPAVVEMQLPRQVRERK